MFDQVDASLLNKSIYFLNTWPKFPNRNVWWFSQKNCKKHICFHMFLEHQISILESFLKDTIQSQFNKISQVYPFIGNIAGLQ